MIQNYFLDLGALHESPLDISNDMGHSDSNVELWALLPNQERCQFDLLIQHKLFLGFNLYMERATMPPPCGLVAFTYHILIALFSNKQYLTLTIPVLSIGLLSSPIQTLNSH
ncbi:hypothetical protein DSO57_1022019 [Entomophthora muscae]|uniref:Uncharacterized protein n=1 Tax=Entomophthora muscae TaxID=34485 RepID=A0ACC2TEG9_9FUNG|nr:hypothetical protein DSO57_1022019 [Entomophthora muscae]